MSLLKEKNHRSGLWLFLILFIVFIAGNLVIGAFFYEEFALYHQLVDVLIPCLVYLIATGQPIISTLKLNVGLSAKNIWRIFQLFLISFLIKYGINYLVAVLARIDSGEVTIRVFEMVPNLWVFFIAVAVIPVILEEVFIRGVILDHFRDVSLLQASVVTGVLFGLMHIDLGQLGYATALGIIMAAIVLVTGSLWGGILFHFFNNFTSFAVLAALKKMAESFPEIFDLQDILEVQPLETGFTDNLLMIVIAVSLLIAGVYMTVHYIKKMIRENGYEMPVSHVSWKGLFVNAPMGILLALYIGLNVVLYF
ncbi:CPBP family intramembrane glutamic endopeptidase [Alkalibacter saccharofermentans]|uniref:CAAX protease self-immunity n=1 Tax=Alkalibacter saccharofermentans DSM 14828 TaxID=1120975 RepID=A0A1M4WVH9_9FIRM|nr:type II CAAX endopeptidase family protein [Alkalibacter saccharofermentans]SHE85073.1 CAAX protease self-immunity [Alkalibacter saccharofermentans DSM 14828]